MPEPKRPRPTGRPGGERPRRPRPKCVIEIVDPDDILVIGINERWFKTFTSTSHRYPAEIEVPAQFLNDGWNLVSGDYTNVAIQGHKQEATVEYKVKLDGKEVVHTVYKTELLPHTFTLKFKDTFGLGQRSLDNVTETKRMSSSRFQNLMEWQQEEGQE